MMPNADISGNSAHFPKLLADFLATSGQSPGAVCSQSLVGFSDADPLSISIFEGRLNGNQYKYPLSVFPRKRYNPLSNSVRQIRPCTLYIALLSISPIVGVYSNCLTNQPTDQRTDNATAILPILLKSNLNTTGAQQKNGFFFLQKS